jgi:hypothetical protein
LELATGLDQELFPNNFSISFAQAAYWRRFRDLRNNIAFCQSAAAALPRKTFAQKDICPERHLPRRHLPRKTFAPKTFAKKDICPGGHLPRKTFPWKTFAHKDVCPKIHLTRKTFAQKDVCPEDEKSLSMSVVLIRLQ